MQNNLDLGGCSECCESHGITSVAVKSHWESPLSSWCCPRADDKLGRGWWCVPRNSRSRCFSWALGRSRSYGATGCDPGKQRGRNIVASRCWAGVRQNLLRPLPTQNLCQSKRPVSLARSFPYRSFFEFVFLNCVRQITGGGGLIGD